MFHRDLSTEGQSLCFKEVLPKEIEILRNARVKREVPQREKPLEQDIVGLAFSGGGIRSATFNLGVIQALANKNLLRFVDYLSTVSGGGYIGSWLSCWAYYLSLEPGNSLNHAAQIEAELNRHPQRIGDSAEPPQVHFLRKYSNYLTPRLGALSGDTLAFLGTYVRNLLLNQMILVSALLALLLVPRALGLIFSHFYGSPTAYVSAILAVLLLLVVAVGVALNSHAKPYSPRGVVYLIALPQFLFCLLTTYALWQFVTADGAIKKWLLPDTWEAGLFVVGASAIVYAVLWFLAVLAGLLLEAGTQAGPRPNLYLAFAPALWSFPAGAVAGALLLLDFRDEVIAQIFDKGDATPKRSLTFRIEVTDEGSTHGTPFLQRRTFANWRSIGHLRFDNAVISYNGDFVLHFNHPTWRDNRNDPSTATRVHGRKVR